MACQTITEFTNERMEHLKTDYRESPNIRGLIRTYVMELARINEITCAMPDTIDIDTSVGNQLDIIGKWVGWPRIHCSGKRLPFFGFECPPTVCPSQATLVTGFCGDGVWQCSGEPAYDTYTFADDELYRRFLKAKVITNSGDVGREALVEAAKILFGGDALIYHETPGNVAVATGRLLTTEEISIAHIYEQVLPIAPGVDLDIWQSDGQLLGFGTGWSGLCVGSFASFVI